MHRSLILMCAAATSMVTGRASAQASHPKDVPYVVVNAIFGGFAEAFGGTLQFSNGTTPEGWRAALTPPAPAVVVGGARFGPLTLTVFELPRSANVALLIDSTIARSGMTLGKGPSALPGMSAFTIASPSVSRTYCSKSGAASVTQVDSTPTTRLIAVAITADPNSSMACHPEAAEMAAMSRAPLQVPPLRAPPGASASQGNSGYGSDNLEVSAHIDTTFTPEELLTHYGKQLSSAGWTVSPTAIKGDDIAIRRLTTKDKQGNEWRGVLMVLTGVRDRQLTIRMVKDREQR
ncbi:MAG: hypothetical protein ABIY52_02485 [Gemmatimonadaceae bacterium]